MWSRFFISKDLYLFYILDNVCKSAWTLCFWAIGSFRLSPPTFGTPKGCGLPAADIGGKSPSHTIYVLPLAGSDASKWGYDSLYVRGAGLNKRNGSNSSSAATSARRYGRAFGYVWELPSPVHAGRPLPIYRRMYVKPPRVLFYSEW